VTDREHDLFGLLELGSNSLKFHAVADAACGKRVVETTKFPWRIAHEFFDRGELSDCAVDEVVQRIRDAERAAGTRTLARILTIATGVFRELDDLKRLAMVVEDATGVRVRVISGRDEARLMARGFREQRLSTPSILCDLGGATMEWVWMRHGGKPECGSVRLGAIRGLYRFRQFETTPARYLAESAAYCDRVLCQLPRVADVIVTGGTADAAAQVLGANVVDVRELSALIDCVLEDGPPSGLSSARQEVFLPGLVILWRLAARCGASALRYQGAAVRHGLVERLLGLLQELPAEELRTSMLLESTDKRI
jgi:exopolyphosphatase/guanosine-5'-triphosphate,3'-diphosphate pyrophosphatase